MLVKCLLNYYEFLNSRFENRPFESTVSTFVALSIGVDVAILVTVVAVNGVAGGRERHRTVSNVVAVDAVVVGKFIRRRSLRGVWPTKKSEEISQKPY